MSNSALIKLLVRQKDELLKLLHMQASDNDVSAPPPKPEPEPPRLRQSQQPGVDMRRMGEEATARARAQSLHSVFARRRRMPD